MSAIMAVRDAERVQPSNTLAEAFHLFLPLLPFDLSMTRNHNGKANIEAMTMTHFPGGGSSGPGSLLRGIRQEHKHQRVIRPPTIPETLVPSLLPSSFLPSPSGFASSPGGAPSRFTSAVFLKE